MIVVIEKSHVVEVRFYGWNEPENINRQACIELDILKCITWASIDCQPNVITMSRKFGINYFTDFTADEVKSIIEVIRRYGIEPAVKHDVYQWLKESNE